MPGNLVSLAAFEVELCTWEHLKMANVHKSESQLKIQYFAQFWSRHALCPCSPAWSADSS